MTLLPVLWFIPKNWCEFIQILLHHQMGYDAPTFRHCATFFFLFYLTDRYFIKHRCDTSPSAYSSINYYMRKTCLWLEYVLSPGVGHISPLHRLWHVLPLSLFIFNQNCFIYWIFYSPCEEKALPSKVVTSCSQHTLRVKLLELLVTFAVTNYCWVFFLSNNYCWVVIVLLDYEPSELEQCRESYFFTSLRQDFWVLISSCKVWFESWFIREAIEETILIHLKLMKESQRYIRLKDQGSSKKKWFKEA